MATQHPEYTYLLFQNQTRLLDLAAQSDVHIRADKHTPTFSDSEVYAQAARTSESTLSVISPRSIWHVKKTRQIASLHASLSEIEKQRETESKASDRLNENGVKSKNNPQIRRSTVRFISVEDESTIVVSFCEPVYV